MFLQTPSHSKQRNVISLSTVANVKEFIFEITISSNICFQVQKSENQFSFEIGFPVNLLKKRHIKRISIVLRKIYVQRISLKKPFSALQTIFSCYLSIENINSTHCILKFHARVQIFQTNKFISHISRKSSRLTIITLFP